MKRVNTLLVPVFLCGFVTWGTNANAFSSPQTAEERLVDPVKNGPFQKVGPWLGNLYAEFQQSPDKKAFKTRNPILRVEKNRVGVEMYASDSASLLASLVAWGATDIRVKGPLVAAQVPVASLADLAALPSLEFASPVMTMNHSASQGNVVSQGEVSFHADIARAANAVDGTGVSVGVLSDSFNCHPAAFVPGAPNTTAAQDVANEDLPQNVQVLDNGPCPGTDEGRAMMQLVHDVAPGSSLKFHTAQGGQLNYATGILELRAAGANVIVDDVIYFAEPMFSDGIVAQAADRAVDLGAAYFSVAGNQARLSYESAYREELVSSPSSGNINGNGDAAIFRAHDFGTGAGIDTLQQVRVSQLGGQAVIVFSFQWDQPFLSSTTYAHVTDPTSTSAPRGATGDMDMLIYNDKGVLVPLCPPGLAVGITCQITGTRNIGRDAVDVAALVTGPKEKTGTYFIRFVRAGGVAPQHVKYVAFESVGSMSIVTHNTMSGTTYGHANAHNVASVGASSWYLTQAFDSFFSALLQDTPGACDPACLRDFSSAGGIPIYFDKYGVPLSSPVVRQAPRFTGPDGGNTSFFLADSSFDDDDGDGCNSPTSRFITSCLDNPADEFPNFFGTSASAPHVAAVAALMLQKNSGLSPNQIYEILADTSQDIVKREVLVLPGPGDSSFSALPSGYDFDSGFGFVDAAAALAATSVP